MTGATTMTSAFLLALMAQQVSLISGQTTVEMATTTHGAMETTTAEPELATTQATDDSGANTQGDSTTGSPDDGGPSGTTGGVSTQTTQTVVSVSLTIANVDFASLSADEALMNTFKDTCKAKVAEFITGVTPDDIEVTITAGSVIVTADITVPDGVDASAVTSDINTAKDAGTMASGLVEDLASIDGIDAVTSGTMTVTISEPTTEVVNIDDTSNTVAGGAGGDDSTESDGAWHAAGISLAALAAAAVALA